MSEVLSREWGDGLIGSWLGAGWVAAPRRIGDLIAGLVGAAPGEVIATDSTSVNIFKVLTAALSLRPDRSVILSESGNFPTDLYMMQGIEAVSGGRVRAETVPPDAVLDRLREDVAVLLLTHIHYKSGAMRDLAGVTARARAAGVLTVWDLSHSVGAVPLDLNGAGADFAVGCGYKYLNGGPGAPAWLFAAGRHQDALPVLSGWFGHARPFDFDDAYEPADGIDRFQCGTPPILGLAALETGVELMLEADMGAIRQKSLQLAELLIAAMEPLCERHGFALVSPRDPGSRGSHVSFAHLMGYPIMQALKAARVIGDFRAPDILRFGLTPLTLRHIDIVEAVDRLAVICDTRAWDRPDYHVRAAVT
jgi:kynureninase